MMLTDYEIASLRPPCRMPISDWIEANRILHESYAAEPGPKSISRTPFVRPILEAWQDPWVREIVVCKSAQIGLTDLSIDLVGHTAANDPCPMAVFLADQLTAEKVMSDRIQPMLRSTAAIRSMIDENRITKQEAYLRNGFNLTCSWASSIAQTASRPFKNLILDEINKPGYAAVGSEGSALGRLRQRQETFSDSKLLMMSTPTIDTGAVTAELATCEIVFDWHVPCPHCGSFQPLRFFPEEVAGRKTGMVVWEGGREASREQIENTARYKCADCSELWTTQQKNDAVSHGKAISRGELVSRARKIGFHLNRLISLFPGGRLDALVLTWIGARQDASDMQNFYNSALGEAWVQRVSASQDDATAQVLACRAAIGRGIVPDEAIVIVIGCDVQQSGIWWRARAFSRDMTSWGIDEGIAGTWADLESILFERQWHTADGRLVPVWRIGIDTGGGKEEGALVSRTEETYEFIRRNRGRGAPIFGTKGSSRSMATKINIGKPIERMPSGKPIVGGIQIVQINTDVMKEALWWRIDNTKEAGPGSWYLHEETPEWVARQITAEEKRRDLKGVVVWHPVRRDNHLLDCEAICLALVDPEFWGGVRAVRIRGEEKPKPAAPTAPNPFIGGLFNINSNPYTGR